MVSIQQGGSAVIQLDSCPVCGGPLIDSGDSDIRCINFGKGLKEFVDYLGDEEIVLAEEFVGENADGSGAEDDSDW